MPERDPFDSCDDRYDCISYAETMEIGAKDNAEIFDAYLNSRLDPLFTGEAPEPVLVDLATIQQRSIIDMLRFSPYEPCSQRCPRILLLGKIMENRL